ncbi:hypothetical protein ACJMK2_009451 [Sinanodonta woodiana]|uniref:ATP-dependent DNA helicase n=1 Tax=Sinanodonta woodiana TaxID=1069815 RepID=A0ABD3VF94_SINWO
MKTTCEKIKSADVLLVDEVTRFSKRHLENLEYICFLKDPKHLFGEMQIVFLCGDFFQLPPVRNILYDDDYSYSFESDLFDMVFIRIVLLKNILSRPLADNGMSSLKRFSTNQIADDYNRNQILKIEGDLFIYVAQDSGEKKRLHQIGSTEALVEKEMLSTLDTKYIGHPSEWFTGIQFQKKENLSEITQLLLKLEFALTIHKSQGMILDRGEIDCRQIAQPGQLDVAIGRVRTLIGLPVINFSKDAFFPQLEQIRVFGNQLSDPEVEDFLCCHRAICASL